MRSFVKTHTSLGAYARASNIWQMGHADTALKLRLVGSLVVIYEWSGLVNELGALHTLIWRHFLQA